MVINNNLFGAPGVNHAHPFCITICKIYMHIWSLWFSPIYKRVTTK